VETPRIQGETSHPKKDEISELRDEISELRDEISELRDEKENRHPMKQPPMKQPPMKKPLRCQNPGYALTHFDDCCGKGWQEHNDETCNTVLPILSNWTDDDGRTCDYLRNNGTHKDVMKWCKAYGNIPSSKYGGLSASQACPELCSVSMREAEPPLPEPPLLSSKKRTSQDVVLVKDRE
jgi:hypothetical protein